MMGLLHAAHTPFDSVLTPWRVIFSFRFAISSLRVSVSDVDPLLTCDDTGAGAVPCELATLDTGC